MPIGDAALIAMLHRVDHRIAVEIDVVRHIRFGGADLVRTEHPYSELSINQFSKRNAAVLSNISVSYTHLTLPTIYSV